MKAMFAALVALVMITVGAWYALDNAGFSIEDRTSGDAVRLG